MAHAHRSSTFEASTSAVSQVWFRISPVIEREFIRRDVFPELRLEKAYSVIRGATGVHLVSVERAREVLADAHAQHRIPDLPRGLSVAYRSLVRNITDALMEEARRGLIDDPGMGEVQRQQALSSACFAIGDSVLYFRDDDEYGREAIIVDGYRMYSVTGDDGPYITKEGKRLEYRYGYAIKLKNSDSRFFVPAYKLTRDDCKPSHLSLVASRPANIFCLQGAAA